MLAIGPINAAPLVNISNNDPYDLSLPLLGLVFLLGIFIFPGPV
jgi:hypothetical protein|nr:MAG TPA: hypothetical protein [Bacteriophage sp.]DAX15098.1 MAG TPA: hypothetical protein [Bacteriophage sp.]